MLQKNERLGKNWDENLRDLELILTNSLATKAPRVNEPPRVVALFLRDSISYCAFLAYWLSL